MPRASAIVASESCVKENWKNFSEHSLLNLSIWGVCLVNSEKNEHAILLVCIARNINV
jgi:hypothetical protein